MWSVESSQTPVSYKAKYVFYLPVDQKVLHSEVLNSPPLYHYGSLDNFISFHYGSPIIPIDPHTALSLEWLSREEFVNNAPYLDETVKAAIKLVLK